MASGAKHGEKLEANGILGCGSGNGEDWNWVTTFVFAAELGLPRRTIPLRKLVVFCILNK